MTPAGGVYPLSPAPVSTKNRFTALAEIHIVDSNGAGVHQDENFDLLLFVKLPVKLSKLSKKRMGRRPLSCISTSASTASGNMFPPIVKSMIFQVVLTPVDPALIRSPIPMALGYIPHGAPRRAALPLHRRISVARVTNTLVRPTLVFIIHIFFKPLILILAYL